jgi:hypothetical protein
MSWASGLHWRVTRSSHLRDSARSPIPSKPALSPSLMDYEEETREGGEGQAISRKSWDPTPTMARVSTCRMSERLRPTPSC